MLNLINKAKWLLGGNILFAFSQWLMLIIFSHFSSPLQLGYYSYALAITAPILMLSNLQLRPLLVADLNIESKFNFSQYFSLRLITTTIAIFICLFFIDWTNYHSMTIILLVILLKASEAISDIIYAFYNAKKKTKFISKSLTVKSILIVTLSFTILYLTNSIVYSLAATLVAYLLVLFFIDIKQNKIYISSLNFSDKEFKKLIVMGLPLGIAVMLVSLQTNIPRYFLEHYMSVELVGVYTIFYYFLVIGGIVINSVCQYLSPYFSEFYRDSNVYELKRMISHAMLIALALGVIGLVTALPFHGFIIKIIYGNDYVKYSYLLPYMMFAGIFTYLSVVNGYLLTSLKLLNIQLPIFAILVLLIILYSYFLIPLYGLLGAAYTTILSAVSQFVISSIVVYKRVHGLALNV